MVFWIDQKVLDHLYPAEVRALQQFRLLTAMSEILGEDALDEFLRVCYGLLEDALPEGHEAYIVILRGIIEKLEDLEPLEVPEDDEPS